jgi:hypothetical protein
MKVSVASRHGSAAGSFEIKLHPETESEVEQLQQLETVCRFIGAPLDIPAWKRETGWSAKRKLFTVGVWGNHGEKNFLY